MVDTTAKLIGMPNKVSKYTRLPSVKPIPPGKSVNEPNIDANE